MGLSLSSSKRVTRNLRDSTEFTTACETTYEESLSLAQHAFPGLRPYQIASASDRLHHSLSTDHHIPLIDKWVPDPPSRSQVDKALRSTLAATADQAGTNIGLDEFKEFAVVLYTDAVLTAAGNAMLRRVPIGVAGIAGVGIATRSGKEMIGAVLGVYALGVATSIYLGFAL